MSRYESQTSKKKSPAPIAIAVLILLITFALWMFWENQKNNGEEIKTIAIPKENIRLNTKKKAQPSKHNNVPDNKPEKISENIAKLPELENSDSIFRHQVSSVSTNLSNWFSARHIIHKYILLINDLSQGQLIPRHRLFLQPAGKMKVKSDSQGLYLTENSYRRYDRLANAIDAIDVDRGLQLYISFKPLFDKVYKTFSYPAHYRLDDIFLKAAANVIKAPVIEGRVGLRKHSVKYKFADKKLESLTDVEKQMLRMGPENTRKIQAKLRELVQALVISSE